MIKNFGYWITESRKFKSMPDEKRFEIVNLSFYEIHFNDNQLIVYQKHPNMGKIKWFTLDKNSNFSTDTTASEFFAFEKITELLNSLKTDVNSSILKKWLDLCKEKYKTKILSKKFGI